jgi:hypothetical protein
VVRSLKLIVLSSLLAACNAAGDDPAASADASSSGAEAGGSDSDSAADTEAGSESGTSSADESTGTTGGTPSGGLPVLGWGTHALSAVEFSIISTPADGLARPSDLEFNPEVPGELWVTNLGDSSMTIYEQAGTSAQTASRRFNAGSGPHFLAKPSALAFGASGFMATAQQEDEVTQPSTPADFMGPTLWTSDSAAFEGGDPSHYDMLHNSPLSSGIAWEKDNVYWVFDGMHGSLTRYDFAADHGPGGTDHADGIIHRFVDGQLGYEPGVASHVVLDEGRGLLFAADTANGRIVSMDPSIGTLGAAIAPNYDGADQTMVEGSMIDVMMDGTMLDPGMLRPSGIELHEDVLYVSDYESSLIFGFSPEGELLDWLDTELPAETLMGLAFDTDGSLYGVDASDNQVFRIQPIEAPEA